jgi:hypothetical protein
MRNWQTIAGGMVWMLIAVSVVLAALQPVTVSVLASLRDDMRFVAVCADGSSNLLMGCASMYL